MTAAPYTWAQSAASSLRAPGRHRRLKMNGAIWSSAWIPASKSDACGVPPSPPPDSGVNGPMLGELMIVGSLTLLPSKPVATAGRSVAETELGTETVISAETRLIAFGAKLALVGSSDRLR